MEANEALANFVLVDADYSVASFLGEVLTKIK